ncbi:cysteine-rich repeat secretory protein 38-like [Vicia villosa]|uniref:cysteine-rich repeat secretory protein 38-like n=1 Tax=Vicia villosa TaxID=3911 RepID=UPI00273BB98E|nr:cysteine-rich repeat secretory protein 38-like [Vicia villosa]
MEPRLNLKDGKKVSGVEFELFNNSVYGLLNEVAVKAAHSTTAKKFATGEVRIARTSLTVYGLGQCVTDLTSPQYEMCLEMAIRSLAECCGGEEGASAMLASCVVRYELYPFYNVTSSSSSGNLSF